MASEEAIVVIDDFEVLVNRGWWASLSEPEPLG